MSYNQFKIILIGIILSLIIINPAQSGPNVTLNYSNQHWGESNWLVLLLSPLTDLMGNMVYVIIMGMLFGVLYIKTKNTVAISIMGLLTAGAGISLVPPEFHSYALLALGLAIAVIIYRAFYRNE